MSEPMRKITVNVPVKALDRATELTGKGITGTVVEGLLELERREKRSALQRLKGKVAFELDLEKSRQ